PAAWCRAPSWSSISTTRTSTATPTPSRCSSAASARSSASTSSRRCAGSAICSPRRAMRANSLALRLFVSATAWTVVILLITGFALPSLYGEGVERWSDRRLNVFLRTLVAEVAAPDEAGERPSQALGEPEFDLPLSGWYWQLTRLNGPKPEVRSSRSLWDSGLPHLSDQGVAASDDGTRRAYVVGPEDQRLRLIERTVDLGADGPYLV